MTQKKIEVLSEYFIPFLNIIKRRGFFYIHADTITQMGPDNFFVMLDAKNLKIRQIKNDFKLFKITKK